MSEDKGNLLGALWFFSALVLVALFIGAGAQGELTGGHIVLALAVMGLAAAGTFALWSWQSDDTQQSKAKRESMDTLLRDMSAEDLRELKARLENIDSHDESVVDYVGDDGELVWRS